MDTVEYTIIEKIPVTPLVFPNNTSEQGKLPYEVDIREVIRNNIVFRVHSLVYTCSDCDRKFNNTGNFERHVQTHRNRKRPYLCDGCNMEFTSYTKYLQHRESHNIACPECQYTFRTNSQLTMHRRKNHKQDRPFRCDTCGKSFQTAWNLKQHERTHQAASHCCEFCSKAYKRKEDLLKHYETH
ncbi:zinc finger protein 135-like [Ochlerotatus camptorhynchus]|uniref:zinc finger protein 135-like n=1 Tax=Ochlerotatus camptorhynchus TaxID=644619 RepID=UPI0031CF0248